MTVPTSADRNSLRSEWTDVARRASSTGGRSSSAPEQLTTLMSQTYVHYHEPSSLPSDYALVSRYQAAFHSDNDSSKDRAADAVTDDRERNLNDDADNDDYRPQASTSQPIPVQDASNRKSKPRRFTSPSQNRTQFIDNQHLSPVLEREPRFLNNPNESTPLLAQVPQIQEPSTPDNALPTLWEEFRILFRYTVPVFGSHLLEYSLVLATVISIGHISTIALAASTLGSMTAGVTAFSIIQGFSGALDTLLPSAWTSNRPELVGVWSARMGLVMAGLLVPILSVWFNAESILLLLRQDLEVAQLAATYLKYLSLGLPAYCFNAIIRRYFQSQGLFTIPTKIILIVCPFNALLNYILVWVPPFAMGFQGAPIATAISFNMISFFSLIAAVRLHRSGERRKKAWKPMERKELLNVNGLLTLLHLGLAGAGQTASEWWSWELIGLAASLINPVALASQSVLLVSASTTYQAPFALSVAVAVRIGNLLGTSDARRAKLANDASLVMALLFAFISSALFLIFRNQWAYIFNDDPEVADLVAKIIPLVALFQVFDGLAACAGGILRARGKQVLGAILNLSSYYVIGIPFGVFLAFSPKLKMGLAGLWIGLTLSLVYSATVGVWVCMRTDWEKEVSRVEGLLSGEGAAASGDRDRDVNNVDGKTSPLHEGP